MADGYMMTIAGAVAAAVATKVLTDWKPGRRTHDVEEGDTLSDLAGRYYNDRSKFHIIADANKTIVPNPDEIYPGQRLVIPRRLWFR